MTLIEALSRGFEKAKEERVLEWPKEKKSGLLESWLKKEFFIFLLTILGLTLRNVYHGEPLSDQWGLWCVALPLFLLLSFVAHVIWWGNRNREWQESVVIRHNARTEPIHPGENEKRSTSMDSRW